VHDPEFAPSLDVVCKETLPALQKIKESGKCRFIGLTGYPMGNFRKMIEGTSVKVDTALCYCHYSMNDSSLSDYLPYFKEQGIGVINASPLSMGLLSDRGPPSWHPATDDIRSVCKQAAEYCKREGVDISKLATHYSLANADIPTTLVSTARYTGFCLKLVFIE
jgi:aryl-alcohol dehydrogenase-like predicted oxidoreductase